MSSTPIPSSPPSSPGSGSLEVRLAPSPRLLVALAAWGVAGGLAIGECAGCGAPVRALLYVACAVVLAGTVAAALPGVVAGAPSGLRRHGDRWELQLGACWFEVDCERAVEMLRSGWWLQLRLAGRGPRRWVWVDAARTPRARYRALCRELRRRP